MVTLQFRPVVRFRCAGPGGRAAAPEELDVTIPVMRPVGPSLDRIGARLRTVWDAGRFANFGPQEESLRSRLAVLLGVPANTVMTAANATLALTGAVAVLGGRRWSVPAFTFPASVAAVGAAGADPLLSDVNPDSWTLTTPEEPVDGALVVAPFGAAPDLTAWKDSGRVVHDAAASLGEMPDLSGLPDTQVVVFSLHATKVLGIGEGALAVFGSPESARDFREWTNFGFSGTRESSRQGVNAKLSELHAVVAHAALDGWESERAEWREARRLMTAALDSAGIELFSASRSGVNPYTIARFSDLSVRDAAHAALERAGVETRAWWSRGCHRMPAYSALATRPFPGAEHAADVSLGLPMFRGLGADEADRIAAALVAVGRGG